MSILAREEALNTARQVAQAVCHAAKTRVYVSGPDVELFAELTRFGLDVHLQPQKPRRLAHNARKGRVLPLRRWIDNTCPRAPRTRVPQRRMSSSRSRVAMISSSPGWRLIGSTAISSK